MRKSNKLESLSLKTWTSKDKTLSLQLKKKWFALGLRKARRICMSVFRTITTCSLQTKRAPEAKPPSLASKIGLLTTIKLSTSQGTKDTTKLLTRQMGQFSTLLEPTLSQWAKTKGFYRHALQETADTIRHLIKVLFNKLVKRMSNKRKIWRLI